MPRKDPELETSKQRIQHPSPVLLFLTPRSSNCFTLNTETYWNTSTKQTTNIQPSKPTSQNYGASSSFGLFGRICPSLYKNVVIQSLPSELSKQYQKERAMDLHIFCRWFINSTSHINGSVLASQLLRYNSAMEAQAAKTMLKGAELFGSSIVVDSWVKGPEHLEGRWLLSWGPCLAFPKHFLFCCVGGWAVWKFGSEFTRLWSGFS